MIAALQGTLIQLLKLMDEEATTKFQENGAFWPSGLRWYHQHFRLLQGGNMKCEVAWAKRLKTLLGGKGITATQPKYPIYAVPFAKTRQLVDLRIQLPDDSYFWLEIKGSWPVCFSGTPPGVPYVWSRYRSYLLEDTFDDLQKLSALRPPDAHHLGLMLIGFDTPFHRLDDTMAEFELKVPIGWARTEPAEWIEPHYGTRARVWLWHKAIELSPILTEVTPSERGQSLG